MKKNRPPCVAILLLSSFFLTTVCPAAGLGERPVTCEGRYPGHLQGVDWDRHQAIFWAFTSVLVKTDLDGALVRKIDVPGHHGDLCFHRGRIYVAVNFGSFNDPEGNADNDVFVYDADSLELLSRHDIPQVKHGAGGMTWQKGRFIVIGGLPEGYEENYFYEYDSDFRFLGRKVVQSGYSRLGIQAITSSGKLLWCGCYGNALLRVTDDYQMTGRWEFNCGYGLIHVGGKRYMITQGLYDEATGHGGTLVSAFATGTGGLQMAREWLAPPSRRARRYEPQREGQEKGDRK
jgi:hypothetical protein